MDRGIVGHIGLSSPAHSTGPATLDAARHLGPANGAGPGRVGPGVLARRLAPYAAATALALGALALTHSLHVAIGFPNVVLLMPVVILCSARWGAQVGVFTTVFSAAGVAFLTPPVGSLLMDGPGERMLLLTFVVVALISTVIASGQRRLERRLRANEAELRAIFELAAVGTGMVDAATGRFLRVNEQLCRMTGYTRADLLQKTVADITHPDDRERDREVIRGLISGRQDRWSVEKRYVRSDGEVVWVLVNGTIIPGVRGRGQHVIAHAADITDRRRADDALREASRLKDEFLATLSHELRTPLNVVAGWTQMLRTGGTAPDQIARGLAVIDRNTEALRRLTDDLIGMSSVLTGRVRLDRRLVDLQTVLSDALESVTLAAQAKGISTDVRLGERLFVRGDEARLRQVFWNLLSNAVKFTPAGGTVTATARLDQDRIVVSVADTGIGIPETFLPYVFEKFRQEDASHTRQHQGLGLGLTIARQFTELHGGTIVASSRGRDQGSVFTVSLPAASAPAVAASAGYPEGREAG
jgi:PAS domain S-box-containing protein